MLNTIVNGSGTAATALMQSPVQPIELTPIFCDTLNLLGKIVEGWAEEVPATTNEAAAAGAGLHEVKNAWNWGRAHSAFNISEDRLSGASQSNQLQPTLVDLRGSIKGERSLFSQRPAAADHTTMPL